MRSALWCRYLAVFCGAVVQLVPLACRSGASVTQEDVIGSGACLAVRLRHIGVQDKPVPDLVFMTSECLGKHVFEATSRSPHYPAMELLVTHASVVRLVGAARSTPTSSERPFAAELGTFLLEITDDDRSVSITIDSGASCRLLALWRDLLGGSSDVRGAEAAGVIAARVGCVSKQ